MHMDKNGINVTKKTMERKRRKEKIAIQILNLGFMIFWPIYQIINKPGYVETRNPFVKFMI